MMQDNKKPSEVAKLIQEITVHVTRDQSELRTKEPKLMHDKADLARKKAALAKEQAEMARLEAVVTQEQGEIDHIKQDLAKSKHDLSGLGNQIH